MKEAKAGELDWWAEKDKELKEEIRFDDSNGWVSCEKEADVFLEWMSAVGLGDQRLRDTIRDCLIGVASGGYNRGRIEGKQEQLEKCKVQRDKDVLASHDGVIKEIEDNMFWDKKDGIEIMFVVRKWWEGVKHVKK